MVGPSGSDNDVPENNGQSIVAQAVQQKPQQNYSEKSLLWNRSDNLPITEVLVPIKNFLESIRDLRNGSQTTSLPFTYTFTDAANSGTQYIENNRDLVFKIEERENSNSDKAILYPTDLARFLTEILALLQSYQPYFSWPSFSTKITHTANETEAEFFEKYKGQIQAQIVDLLTHVSFLSGEEAGSTTFETIESLPKPSPSNYLEFISDTLLPLLDEIIKIPLSTTTLNGDYALIFEGKSYRLTEIKKYLHENISLLNKDFSDDIPKSEEFRKLLDKFTYPSWVTKYTDQILQLRAEISYREALSFVLRVNNPRTTDFTEERYVITHKYPNDKLVFPNISPYDPPNKGDHDRAEQLYKIFEGLVSLAALDKIGRSASSVDADGGGESETEEKKPEPQAQLLSLTELLQKTQNEVFGLVLSKTINSEPFIASIQNWANLPENEDLEFSSIWIWIEQQVKLNTIFTSEFSKFFLASAAVATISAPDFSNANFYDPETKQFIVSPKPDGEYQKWIDGLLVEIEPVFLRFCIDSTATLLTDYRALQITPEQTTETPFEASAVVPADIASLVDRYLPTGQPATFNNAVTALAQLQKTDPSQFEQFILATPLSAQLQLHMQAALLVQLRNQGIAINDINDIPQVLRDSLLRDIQTYLSRLTPEQLLRAATDHTSRTLLLSEFNRRFLLQQVGSAKLVSAYVTTALVQAHEESVETLVDILEQNLDSLNPAELNEIKKKLHALPLVLGYTPDNKQNLAQLSQDQIEQLLGIRFPKKLSKEELQKFILIIQKYVDGYYYRQQFEKNTVLAETLDQDAEVENFNTKKFGFRGLAPDGIQKIIEGEDPEAYKELLSLYGDELPDDSFEKFRQKEKKRAFDEKVRLYFQLTLADELTEQDLALAQAIRNDILAQSQNTTEFPPGWKFELPVDHDQFEQTFGPSAGTEPTKNEALGKKLADQRIAEGDKKTRRQKNKNIISKLLGKESKEKKSLADRFAKNTAIRSALLFLKFLISQLINAAIWIATVAIPAIFTLGAKALGFIFSLPFIKFGVIAGLSVGALALAINFGKAILDFVGTAVSNFFNGLSSLFSGSAPTSAYAVGATVAAASVTTLIMQNTASDGMYQLTQESLDVETSKYLEIDKKATPTRIENNTPTEIKYTITIKAKDEYVVTPKLDTVTDTFSNIGKVTGLPDEVAHNQAVKDALRNKLGVAQENTSELPPGDQDTGTLLNDITSSGVTIEYSLPAISGEDVFLVNTFKLDFSVIDTQAEGSPRVEESWKDSASIRIGDPTFSDCFVFVDNNTPETEKIAAAKARIGAREGGLASIVDWSDDEITTLLAAFSTRVTKNDAFMSSLKCDESSEFGPILLFRLKANGILYGGWSIDENAIGFFDETFNYSLTSTEYTVIHELGHTIDKRNAQFRTDFDRIGGGCPPTYNIAACTDTEPFAEAIALFVIYPDYTFNLGEPTRTTYDFPGQRKSQYCAIKRIVFGDEDVNNLVTCP